MSDSELENLQRLNGSIFDPGLSSDWPDLTRRSTDLIDRRINLIGLQFNFDFVDKISQPEFVQSLQFNVGFNFQEQFPFQFPIPFYLGLLSETDFLICIDMHRPSLSATRDCCCVTRSSTRQRPPSNRCRPSWPLLSGTWCARERWCDRSLCGGARFCQHIAPERKLDNQKTD